MRRAPRADKVTVEGKHTDERRWELTEYYRITRWSLATLAPLAAALVVLAFFSHSLTLFLLALQSCIGVLAGAFEVLGMRRALVENAFSVTHGPGKFESFAALLRGVFGVPLALLTLVAAGHRLVDPIDVDYELALVALILVLARAAFSLGLKQRLMSRLDDPSPRLRAAYSFRRGATISSIVVLGLLVVGLAFEDAGMVSFGDRFDPVAAALTALYTLPIAVRQCLLHFNALVDRPLPAEERAFAAETIARRLEDRGVAWRLCTRMNGLERVVEVELEPGFQAPLERFDAACRDVQETLAERFGEVRFAVYFPSREEA
jgi:divalent metal cation (Fe/Co/Zn/Cd) transporter